MKGTKPIDVNRMIDMLKPEAEVAVQVIESAPPLTQGWYGDYLHLISMVAERSASMALLLVMALERAGANQDGLRYAAMIAGILDDE